MSHWQKPPLGALPLFGHPLSKGLVGLLLFNEGSGNKVFDLSGNKLTGTFVSDVTWSAGKFGPALDLAGSLDYLTFTGTPVTITNPWTIIAWAKTDSTGSYPQLVGFWESGGGASPENIGIGTDENVYDLKVISAGETAGNGTVLVPGTWYQIGIMYDGSDFHAILNGAIDYSVTPSGSGWQDSDQFQIGYNHDTSSSHDSWDGQISHVMVWDYAFIASEIAKLYEKPFCMFERDPIELWSPATQGGAAANAPTGNIWGPLGGSLRGVA